MAKRVMDMVGVISGVKVSNSVPRMKPVEGTLLIYSCCLTIYCSV